MLASLSPIFVDPQDFPLKFFVTKGPHRKEIRELIQLHGGEVTVSRAGAFMCLGVPGEKHDGANFHSTEFVADCIEAGQLLEMDGYKLQSENDSPVKKSTGKRVPYTAEDHTLLKDWIRSTSESVTGNKLFINLAQKHPHHSWQSWKDYCLKRFIPGLGPDGIAKLRAQEMDEPQQSPAPGPVEEAQVDSSDESDDEQFSSDQFILQKYEDEFEAILEEFGQWDREDVLMAFNMASGYPNMARAILNVGFCLKKLPSFIQAQIFTPKEDQLFLSNQNGALSALVALKGRTSVENRLQFLRHRTVGQDPEPL